jgi:hypothetical protein
MRALIAVFSLSALTAAAAGDAPSRPDISSPDKALVLLMRWHEAFDAASRSPTDRAAKRAAAWADRQLTLAFQQPIDWPAKIHGTSKGSVGFEYLASYPFIGDTEGEKARDPRTPADQFPCYYLRAGPVEVRPRNYHELDFLRTLQPGRQVRLHGLIRRTAFDSETVRVGTQSRRICTIEINLIDPSIGWVR